MSRSLRFLMVALLVVALAAAATLLVAQRTGGLARQSVLEVATTGDLRDLFASHGDPQSMQANLALRRLESDYYKPVDPQTPIAGETSALRSFLASKKIPAPSLPAPTANGVPSDDGARAASVLSYAQQHYGSDVGPGADDDLTDAALRGIMSSVHDPYTVYLSPREIRGLNESLSGGNFGGIGVYIYQLKDGRIVVQPIEDLPASRAGMKPGEVVDSVDGKPVRGVSIDRVEVMIRGEAGTVVHLSAHPYNKRRRRSHLRDRARDHPRADGARQDGRRHRLHPPLRLRHDLGRGDAQGAARRQGARGARLHPGPARQRRRPARRRGRHLELLRAAGDDRLDHPARRPAHHRRGARHRDRRVDPARRSW